jgi:hypothetical protein
MSDSFKAAGFPKAYQKLSASLLEEMVWFFGKEHLKLSYGKEYR